MFSGSQRLGFFYLMTLKTIHKPQIAFTKLTIMDQEVKMGKTLL